MLGISLCAPSLVPDQASPRPFLGLLPRAQWPGTWKLDMKGERGLPPGRMLCVGSTTHTPWYF